MRFRVTSIQDEGLPSTWNDCQPWLEDWLNASLGGDAAFGSENVHVMLVIMAFEALLREPRPSRLTRMEDGSSWLALHVVIAPDAINEVDGPEHLALLCRAVHAGLPDRLMRKPKGLDYARLRLAMQACVGPFMNGGVIA